MNTAFRCLALNCVMLFVLAASLTAQRDNDVKQAGASPGAPDPKMEMTIFARFHSLEGKQEEVAAELRDAVTRVSKEPGCLSIEVYRSVRDPRLFFLHSRWVDESAFDRHVALPATNEFVDHVQRLIDHPFDVTRTRLLE